MKIMKNILLVFLLPLLLVPKGMERSKPKRFGKDDGAASDILLGALLVAVVLGAAVFFGVLSIEKAPARPAGAGAFVGGGAAPAAPASVPTVLGLLTDPDAQQEYNQKELISSNPVDVTISVYDVSAGGATGGIIGTYAPNQGVQDPNPIRLAGFAPDAESTSTGLKAGGYYKVIFASTTTYYPTSFCDPEGSKIATSCKIPVEPNKNIARIPWTADWYVRRVAVISDPVPENAVTDSAGRNWLNGQSNNTPAADNCVELSPNDNGGPVATDDATANGDRLWIQNDDCTGTFYFVTMWEAGVAANRWSYKPVACFTDAAGNRSGDEFTAVSLARESGDGFPAQLSDVTTLLNTRTTECVKFYNPTTPFIKSGLREFHRWTFTYANTPWAAGEGFELHFDDIGESNGWLINSTLSGSAEQIIRIRKGAE